MTKRESRARIKLIQEAHLKKAGQRVLDTIHHDIGTSYADLYAMFHTVAAFKEALKTIADGFAAWGTAAANTFHRLNGGHYSYGAGLFQVDAMRITQGHAYLHASVWPNATPMEVNVQMIKEATP